MRALARISQDEVTRMVKAVRASGLNVSRVTFDGSKVDVVIAHIGEKSLAPVDEGVTEEGPLAEPKL